MSNKFFPHSVFIPEIAEDVDVFGKYITVRFNIIEAMIRDSCPDDEIEIDDYTLEDLEMFSEVHCKNTGKPDDGYVSFKSEQVIAVVIRKLKSKPHDEHIREAIIKQYHNDMEV